MMKVLYIYAGKRKHLESGSDEPRTQFYGLFTLKKLGFDVTYKEFEDVYPAFLAKILPFNIRHMLMYFPARNYDIVFGSALLPMMFIRSLFRDTTKCILLNISLTRLIASQKEGSFKKKLITFALRKLDGIVCLSKTQCDYLKNHTQFPTDKLHVVPLGVDTSFYTKGDGSYQNVILSVGRDNGRDYKTVCRVAEKMPERKFVIVCSRRNVHGFVIPSNVHIIYDASHSELRELYRHAQLLLLLTHGSGYNDGADCSGQTVLLEAMATGLPAIISHNPCLCEYVSQGKDALVVPPYDVDMVIQKIKQLDNETKRNELSRAAERTIVTRYSESRMAEKLASLFQSIVTVSKL